MTRWCFLGNSHLAAFKLAADDMKETFQSKGISVDTFGSHRRSLRSLLFSGRKLVPDNLDLANNLEWTSGGQREIDLDAYDHVFLIFCESPFSIRPYLAQEGLMPMTDTLVRAVFDSWAQDWPFKLARDIAAAAGDKTRVHLIGEPYLSEDAPVAVKLTEAIQSDERISARVGRIRQFVEDALQEASSDFASVQRPPRHLHDAFDLFTLKEYSRGSVRLEKGLRDAHYHHDMLYMNGDYARHLIGQWAETCA